MRRSSASWLRAEPNTVRNACSVRTSSSARSARPDLDRTREGLLRPDTTVDLAVRWSITDGNSRRVSCHISKIYSFTKGERSLLHRITHSPSRVSPAALAAGRWIIRRAQLEFAQLDRLLVLETPQSTYQQACVGSGTRNNIDASTRNFHIEALIEKPKHVLMPGLFVRAAAFTGEAPPYLTLPKRSSLTTLTEPPCPRSYAVASLRSRAKVRAR